MEEVTADVMKTARGLELEAEPEYVTDSLSNLTSVDLFLMDVQRK